MRVVQVMTIGVASANILEHPLVAKAVQHMKTLACSTLDTTGCEAMMNQAATDCATNLMPLMTGTCQPVMEEMGLAMGGGDPAAIDRFCSSSCLPTLKTSFEGYVSCMMPTITAVTAATVNDPAAAESVSGMDMMGKMGGIFDLICTKEDTTGEYCFLKMQQVSTEMSSFGQAVPGSSLDAQCAVIQDMGCCMTTMLEFYMSMSPNAVPADVTNQLAVCGALPPACLVFNQVRAVKTATLSFTATLPTDPDQLALVLYTLKLDISSKTGIAVGDISIKDVQTSGNSVTVTVYFRADTDAATNALDISGLSSAGLSLGSFSTALGGGAITATGAAGSTISVSGTAIKDVTSGAAAVAPVALLAAVAMLA